MSSVQDISLEYAEAIFVCDFLIVVVLDYLELRLEMRLELQQSFLSIRNISVKY